MTSPSTPAQEPQGEILMQEEMPYRGSPLEQFDKLRAELRAMREERDKALNALRGEPQGVQDESMNMLESIADTDGSCPCCECAELISNFLVRIGYPAAAKCVDAAQSNIRRLDSDLQAMREERDKAFNALREIRARIADNRRIVTPGLVGRIDRALAKPVGLQEEKP